MVLSGVVRVPLRVVNVLSLDVSELRVGKHGLRAYTHGEVNTETLFGHFEFVRSIAMCLPDANIQYLGGQPPFGRPRTMKPKTMHRLRIVWRNIAGEYGVR